MLHLWKQQQQNKMKTNAMETENTCRRYYSCMHQKSNQMDMTRMTSVQLIQLLDSKFFSTRLRHGQRIIANLKDNESMLVLRLYCNMLFMQAYIISKSSHFGVEDPRCSTSFHEGVVPFGIGIPKSKMPLSH